MTPSSYRSLLWIRALSWFWKLSIKAACGLPFCSEFSDWWWECSAWLSSSSCSSPPVLLGGIFFSLPFIFPWDLGTFGRTFFLVLLLLFGQELEYFPNLTYGLLLFLDDFLLLIHFLHKLFSIFLRHVHRGWAFKEQVKSLRFCDSRVYYFFFIGWDSDYLPVIQRYWYPLLKSDILKDIPNIT